MGCIPLASVAKEIQWWNVEGVANYRNLVGNTEYHTHLTQCVATRGRGSQVVSISSGHGTLLSVKVEAEHKIVFIYLFIHFIDRLPQ